MLSDDDLSVLAEFYNFLVDREGKEKTDANFDGWLSKHDAREVKRRAALEAADG